MFNTKFLILLIIQIPSCAFYPFSRWQPSKYARKLCTYSTPDESLSHVPSIDLDDTSVNQNDTSINQNPTELLQPLIAPTQPIQYYSQQPLKVMIFVDGTWCYYSVITGRDSICPIKSRFGASWLKSYRVDWHKLPQIIAKDIQKQILGQYNTHRYIDVVRTHVFTSMRADTSTDSHRHRLVTDFYSCNFDVHGLVTQGTAEKCVDISLAVEMLFLATVPDAYDIAVIVTGDKDFMPALLKTRLKGKRVAVCSMRNSCNREYAQPDAGIRDYDIVWMDDFIDELIVPRDGANPADGSYDNFIREKIIQSIKASSTGSVNARTIGVILKSCTIGAANALGVLKERHASVRSFVEKYFAYFKIVADPNDHSEFSVSLNPDWDEDAILPNPTSATSIGEEITETDSDVEQTTPFDEPPPEQLSREELESMLVKDIKEMLSNKGIEGGSKMRLKKDLVELYLDWQQGERISWNKRKEKAEGKLDKYLNRPTTPRAVISGWKPYDRNGMTNERLPLQAATVIAKEPTGGNYKHALDLEAMMKDKVKAQAITRCVQFVENLFAIEGTYVLSSRELGRHLTKCKLTPELTAHQFIKEEFGSLNLFIKMHYSKFLSKTPAVLSSIGEFNVELRKSRSDVAL